MPVKGVVLIGLDPGGFFGSSAASGHDRREDPRWGQTRALADFAARGWRTQTALSTRTRLRFQRCERCLADHAYDCVVIGAEDCGAAVTRWI